MRFSWDRVHPSGAAAAAPIRGTTARTHSGEGISARVIFGRALPVAIASALLVASPMAAQTAHAEPSPTPAPAASPAQPNPNRAPDGPTAVRDAVLSSSPLCMSDNEDLIRLCTRLESESTSYPVQLTADPRGHHIVVLGYGLTDEGELRDELVTRLAGAKDLAEAFPETPIIVSGGAPKKGKSEAEAMREWLTGHGIDGSRITTEDRSGNTKENAALSSKIVAERGGRGITLMTSRDHMERALNEFRIAAAGKWPVTGAVAQ